MKTNNLTIRIHFSKQQQQHSFRINNYPHLATIAHEMMLIVTVNTKQTTGGYKWCSIMCAVFHVVS